MIHAAIAAIGLAVNASRAIAVAPRERPTWALLELSQQIDPGAGEDYADLRIVDDRGTETPYVVDPACAAIPSRPAAIGDAGFVRGSYTEATLDAGRGGDLYSSVDLSTSKQTFFERVDVAVSDDRATWRESANGALIFRVAGAGDPGSQTIVIPPSRARWIRIRVLDAGEPFPIDAATLGGLEPAAGESMRRLDASEKLVEKPSSTVLRLDLGTPNTRVASLRFQTSQPEFSRDVTVETSDDGTNWTSTQAGRITRFANGVPELDVSLNDAATRYVRAEIDNGNDVPLAHLTASASGPQRVLVFVARPGRTYALVRRRDARAPVYDLGALLEHDDPRVFSTARLVEVQSALPLPPPHAAPSVSQPLVLTLAFAFAIAALGAVTLATLRR